MFRWLWIFLVVVPCWATTMPWQQCGARLTVNATQGQLLADGYAAIWAHAHFSSVSTVPWSQQRAMSLEQLQKAYEELERDQDYYSPERSRKAGELFRSTAATLRRGKIHNTLFAYGKDAAADIDHLTTVLWHMGSAVAPHYGPQWETMEHIVIHPSLDSAWGRYALTVHAAGPGRGWGAAVRLFPTFSAVTRLEIQNGVRSIDLSLTALLQGDPGEAEEEAFQDLVKALRNK